MTAALPPLSHAVHLCVDMQRLFAEPVGWQVAGLAAITPNIARIASALPDRTIFARFTVPPSADAATGAWRGYYRHWSGIVAAVAADPGLIDLVPALEALSGPKEYLDKPTYSMFTAPDLDARLAARGADTVILTGVETDICVLATLVDAVERGLHVIAIADAMTSSDLAAHDATLSLILPRMPDQVTITDSATLMARLAQNA
ncbi:isochorismatase family cysteine hydrolase [Paracoccus sp. (in: a-proteobacteria)]|uniref:isochorismatase family cysteine hydrolase n=1 Tax=Paracoccus sp. TaxID=267 RepID=UPI003A87AC70